MIRVLAPWVIATVFLLLLPLIFTAPSAITIMTQMAITIIFALSYNMLLGQAGMLSFGHAIYMGVGGFACIHAMNIARVDDLPLPLPLAPLIAGLFSMGIATLIGAAQVRRSGAIFAMISMGVVELFASLAIIIYAFFRGGGVGMDRTYGLPVFGVEFLKQAEVYYLVIAWLIAAVALMYLFTRTPVGRMANAVRDNAERAEFIGYSGYTVRLISFSIAGFFAGVAGGLFAATYEITTAENLNLQASGDILMITFLGGVGVFFGPIVGAVVFTNLKTILSLETELWRLYLGALFLATVMFFPTGLAGVLTMHAPALKAGRWRRLSAPYLRTLIPAGGALLALVALVEMAFHLRRAPAGEIMALFWTEVDPAGPAPWALAGLVLFAGAWSAIRTAPQLVAAFEAATSPAPSSGKS